MEAYRTPVALSQNNRGVRHRVNVRNLWSCPGCWGGFHWCSDSVSPGLSAVIWPNPAGFGCMWEITARTLLSTLHHQKYVNTYHIWWFAILYENNAPLYTLVYQPTLHNISESESTHLLPFTPKSMQTVHLPSIYLKNGVCSESLRAQQRIVEEV